MEVVTLNDSDDGISEEDLDRFVAKFPIEPARPRWGLLQVSPDSE